MEMQPTPFTSLLPAKRTKAAKKSTKRSAKKIRRAAPKPVATLAPNKKCSFTSQAAGKVTTKTGKVIAIVKAGENIFQALADKAGFAPTPGNTNTEIRFGRAISANDRYIVAVQKTGANPRNRYVSYYGPTVGTVEKQLKITKAQSVKVPQAPPITL
jgi:hypothetical protein